MRPFRRDALRRLVLVAGLIVSPAFAAGSWLPRHPDTDFRVLVWNVSNDAFFEQAEGHRRVLEAVGADVLVLDEMPADTDAGTIAARLPPRTPPWRVVYGLGGGSHQRSSVAAGSPLRRLPAFDALAYPDAEAAAWTASVPAGHRDRFRANLDQGVAAVGAIVERDGRRLLLVGVDLWCCGDAGSWEESRRQAEAAAIRAAIEATVAAGGVDAVLLGGDLNLVAGPGPLDRLRGEAGKGPLLVPVEARHHDGATWTWDGRGTPYPSGRLDWVLHSAGLVPLQSRIFDTEDLAPDEAAAMALPPGLSKSLGEHRPIVVDFAWR